MDKEQAVDHFISNVKLITDADYGDFMRKSNTYFNRLLEHYPSPTEKEKEILLKLKTKIQYDPDRNVDLTSLIAVDLAKSLKNKA